MAPRRIGWRPSRSKVSAGTAGFAASPSGVETPGLMTGLAGIGYGLLRLAEPRRTPSVLALEPPTHRVSR